MGEIKVKYSETQLCAIIRIETPEYLSQVRPGSISALGCALQTISEEGLSRNLTGLVSETVFTAHSLVLSSLLVQLETKVREDFTIREKVPLYKAPPSAALSH